MAVFISSDKGTAEAGDTCFKFDRGLRKATRPWTDGADRRRGLTEAMVLLLAEGADNRPS